MDNVVPAPVNDVVQALVNLLAYLVVLIAPVIIARVSVWAKAEFERIKRMQPEWVQNLIETAALYGADIAEKIDLSGQLERYGRDKKRIALEAAQRWLREQGYEVDVTVLDEAIENVLFNNPERFQSKPRG